MLEERECYCGAIIHAIEFEGIKRWVGVTVNPPFEASTLCYPYAEGADGEAHHEPIDKSQTRDIDSTQEGT